MKTPLRCWLWGMGRLDRGLLRQLDDALARLEDEHKRLQLLAEPVAAEERTGGNGAAGNQRRGELSRLGTPGVGAAHGSDGFAAPVGSPTPPSQESSQGAANVS